MSVKPIREMATAPINTSLLTTGTGKWIAFLPPNPRRVALFISASSNFTFALGPMGNSNGSTQPGGFKLQAGTQPLYLSIDTIGSAITEPLQLFDFFAGTAYAMEITRG